MTWSEAFDAYCTRHGITSQRAAAELGFAVSTVHYWRKGSEPRGDRGIVTKGKVEAWTHGEVKASPYADPPSDSGTLHAKGDDDHRAAS